MLLKKFKIKINIVNFILQLFNEPINKFINLKNK